jgi:predicted transcriptional regulator
MSNSKRDQSEKIDIGQAQELFNFLDKENIQNDSLENGLIDALGGLFSSHQGEDYDEEAFAKMIKKKTKQRKR